MKFGAILLIFILSFRPLIPLLDYSINYDYISKVLCINKDKPELKCNGKCQLAKEIAKKAAEDSQQDTNNSNSLKLIDVFIIQNNFIFSLKNRIQANVNQNNCKYINLYSYLPYISLLKPPLV